MSTRAEVLSDGTMGGKELLGLTGRLKPLPAPLALAGRLVGVLRAIIEIPTLAMFHPRQQLALSRSITLEFVGDYHLRHIR
jgi:hypothetical protein